MNIAVMKKPPLILISPSTQNRGAEFSDASISLSNRYLEAIIAGGGLPWVMPCVPLLDLAAESVRRCDGVVLTGGNDVQPKLYGSKLSPQLEKTIGPADPERDLLELLLIDEVFRQRKPLLAICRGQQILNVALGGTLLVAPPWTILTFAIPQKGLGLSVEILCRPGPEPDWSTSFACHLRSAYRSSAGTVRNR